LNNFSIFAVSIKTLGVINHPSGRYIIKHPTGSDIIKHPSGSVPQGESLIKNRFNYEPVFLFNFVKKLLLCVTKI